MTLGIVFTRLGELFFGPAPSIIKVGQYYLMEGDELELEGFRYWFDGGEWVKH